MSPTVPVRWKSIRSELDLTPTTINQSGFRSSRTNSFLRSKKPCDVPSLHTPTNVYNMLVDNPSAKFRYFSLSMDSSAEDENPMRSGSSSSIDSKHVILPGCSNFEEELVREVAHFELCDFLIAQLERINSIYLDSDLDSINPYEQSTANFNENNPIDNTCSTSHGSNKQNPTLLLLPNNSMIGDQLPIHNNSNLKNIDYSLGPIEQTATSFNGPIESEKQIPLFHGSTQPDNVTATFLAINVIHKCQQTVHKTIPHSKQIIQELGILEQCLTQTCDFDWAHRTGSTQDTKSHSGSDRIQSNHAKSLPESLSRTSSVLSFTKSVFERTTSPRKKIDDSGSYSGPGTSSGSVSLCTNQLNSCEGPVKKEPESKLVLSTENDLLVSRSRYVLLPPHYSYLQNPNIVTISKNLNHLSSLYLGNPLAQSRIQLLTNWNQEGINPNFFKLPVHADQLNSSQSHQPMPKAICASLPYGLLTNPPVPKSKRKTILMNQNNRCAGCSIFVETRFLKRMRFCEFFGRFFCCVCHSNTLMTLPGNLLSNWDFRMLPVSNFARDRLNQLHHQPLLRTCDFNRQTIAKQISFLDCLSLRRQGSRMLPFMQFCEDARHFMVCLKKLPQHWLGTPEFWSMADLHSVQNGQMALKLREVLNPAVDHLIACTRCRAQGFICEVCHSGSILFPFGQPNTVSCPSCSACYHRACLRNPQPETCPRCIRRLSKRKLHEQTRSEPNRTDKRQS